MKLHRILFAASAVFALATYHPKHELANRAPAFEAGGRLHETRTIIGNGTGVHEVGESGSTTFVSSSGGGIPYFPSTCSNGQIFVVASTGQFGCKALESKP